jgi:Cu(I)/Ag(I) efflux system protein CusF
MEIPMSKNIRRAILVALVASSIGALAQSAPALADGEVRKIDREGRKLTLRHGPLVNLDMPGMTMVFEVRDAAQLDSLQPGDKVRFAAEKIDGQLVVTRIEPAR